MKPEAKKKFVKESLALCIASTLLLVVDLATGESFISGAAGLKFTREEDPLVYWPIMLFYLVFSVLLYRSYLKDKKLLSDE